MITKTAAGLRFIYNGPPQSAKHRRFDPWAVHAVFIDAIDNTLCNSGLSVDFTTATLVDGTTYYYVCNKPYLLGVDGHIGKTFAIYQVPGYPGFWTGEAYNAVVRGAAFTKFNNADFLAYLAAN